MLAVVLGTSAALAGQQKPTHTRVVSPNCNAQCVVALRDLLFPLHCNKQAMLNTLKRGGELESATYFDFWGTVIQWKICMAVDRTEFVCPSVQ